MVSLSSSRGVSPGRSCLTVTELAAARAEAAAAPPLSPVVRSKLAAILGPLPCTDMVRALPAHRPAIGESPARALRSAG